MNGKDNSVSQTFKKKLRIKMFKTNFTLEELK